MIEPRYGPHSARVQKFLERLAGLTENEWAKVATPMGGIDEQGARLSAWLLASQWGSEAASREHAHHAAENSDDLSWYTNCKAAIYGEDPPFDPATGESLSAPLLDLTKEELARVLEWGGPEAWVIRANLDASIIAIACGRSAVGDLARELAQHAAAALTGGVGGDLEDPEELAYAWQAFEAVIPIASVRND